MFVIGFCDFGVFGSELGVLCWYRQDFDGGLVFDGLSLTWGVFLVFR